MVDSRYNVVFDDMDVDVRGTASYEGIFILRSTKSICVNRKETYEEEKRRKPLVCAYV